MKGEGDSLLTASAEVTEEAIYGEKNISREIDDFDGGGLFSDAEVEARFEYLTEGVILTIVSCVGLIGNVMSIFVLMRVSVRGSFSVLLRGLAIFDALFLLTAILAFGIPKLWPWYHDNLFVYFMAASFGLLHTFRVGSVCVTLAVNFERFHAIVFPLKHFRWKKYLLPMSVAFALTYNLPKYFEMKIETADNVTTIVPTDLRLNHWYFLLYGVWSKIIFIEIIPYISILICNAFIITKITKSANFRKKSAASQPERLHPQQQQQQFLSPVSPSLLNTMAPAAMASNGAAVTANGRKKPFFPRGTLRLTTSRQRERLTSLSSHSRRQKEEHGLGIILVGMSALFIVCQSIKMIPDLYEVIWCSEFGNECEMPAAVDMFIRVSHLLVCFNSSANFVVYYLNGEKFRDAWLQTYGHCFRCCGAKGGNSGSSGRRGSGCNGGDESPVSRLGRSSNFGHGTDLLSEIGGPTPRNSVRRKLTVTRVESRFVGEEKSFRVEFRAKSVDDKNKEDIFGD